MSRPIHTHWHEIVAPDFAVEVLVSYLAYPGSPPDLWGDYPHPGDDPEFKIQGARFLSQYGMAELPLTDAECEGLAEGIAERHDFAAEERDADAWRDARLDDQLCGAIP